MRPSAAPAPSEIRLSTASETPVCSGVPGQMESPAEKAFPRNAPTP